MNTPPRRTAWLRTALILPVFGVLLFLGVACGPPAHDATRDDIMVTLPSLRDVPVENWKALAGKRLFLGHQSVGGNILEGISDLMHEHPEIRLSIVEGTRSELFDRPVLAHSTVGRNGDPLSKMRDFQRMMDQGLGGRVDLAFFKFCYLDFDSRSDVESIFSTYLEIMTGLQERYPGTRFLHATAPLRSMPVSGIERIKHLVKRLLGKPGGRAGQ